MSKERLRPLGEFAPAPGRKGFRTAPPDWPGPADAIAPVFPIAAAELWRAWIGFARRSAPHAAAGPGRAGAAQPQIQRSPVLRLPDLVPAEVVALGAARSSLVLDSGARYGCWDLGVNRRRVLRWIRGLERAPDRDGTPAPRNGGRAALD